MTTTPHTQARVAVVTGAIAIEADVTDRDSILAAAQRVKQELGGADVLVNNAGVMLLGPFSADQRDDYRHMIEVNLLGAITATEVFLDQLKDGAKDRGGDIINISSVAARTARAGNGVYAATELPDHITHGDTRQGVQELYSHAEVIGFVLSRPRQLAINEVLLRPASQA